MDKKEYKHQWYLNNKERLKQKSVNYRKTKIGRASYLLYGYSIQDRRNGFDEKIDFNAKWIVENILSKPCAHCGETDWTKIGCNRIDNSKPHTMDNVEPCCKKCNGKLEGNETKHCIYQYTIDGKLVKKWDSSLECARNGYDRANIRRCCLGISKTHKGYKWSYVPL